MTEIASTPGYSEYDTQRWVPEYGKSSRRTEFERDRARVLHSSALRRLGAKTQVLAPSSDDFIRTRLTHSLEVAQVGREFGRALGCDPDVVDTACLSHDLGHPPFGHNGEKALNEAARSIGGFEANAQTLRLLTSLEPKITFSNNDGGEDQQLANSAGLNLTRASLDASCKYPWKRERMPEHYSEENAKFGVYMEDDPVFDWFRTQYDGSKTPEYRRCIEAQVMDLADDISYSVHDVEDAIQGCLVQLEQLGNSVMRARVIECTRAWYVPDIDEGDVNAALRRLEETPRWVGHMDGSRPSMAALKNMTSQLIGRFATAIIERTQEVYGNQPLTRYSADVVVPEETRLEIAVLKGIAATFVMTTDERKPYYERQRDVLHDLVATLYNAGDEYLDVMFAHDWHEAGSDVAKLRVIIDQVASFTDNSALELHGFLAGEGLIHRFSSV